MWRLRDTHICHCDPLGNAAVSEGLTLGSSFTDTSDYVVKNGSEVGASWYRRCATRFYYTVLICNN